MSVLKLSVRLASLAALACALLAVPALADSQARIVRLSDVEGAVQIDRNIGQGYEKAFLNMPITEGAKLWARDDGRAEIEFEDGSVVRITPNTKVEFTQLSLRDSGAKLSTVKIEEGTAYINFTGQKSNEFTINFARESARLTHAAHFRVDLEDADATLAVLKGDVEIEGPSGSVEVGKKQTATFDLADKDRYTVAKNFEQDPYDNWDKQQEQYHDRYLNAHSYDASMPYSYGVSDLNYYGTYYNVPGYGQCWQPYFTGVGWDPFMNGAWVWYPGFGYTWVSSYPWGWMPYRYGSWIFAPSYGWLWQPGGWNNWYTVPRVVNPPQRFTPPRPPSTGGQQTVVVGRAPSGSPGVPPRRTVMIDRGSAGLGVPRGGVRNLDKISQAVESQGSTKVQTRPPARIAPTPPSGYTMKTQGYSGGMSTRTTSPSSRTSAPAHASAPAPRVSTPAPRNSAPSVSHSSPPSRH